MFFILAEKYKNNVLLNDNYGVKMKKKTGIIGYGNMGKMILSKIVESKIIPESSIFLSNRTYEKIMELNTVYPELKVCKTNNEAAKNADMLFLCVKPLEIKTVLSDIVDEVSDNCHIISLNGSVLFEQIEKICAGKKITKAIPSITAEVNQSVTLICHNKHVKDSDKNEIKTLLECFGTTIEITENEIGMGAELTSCMPGFIGAIFKVISTEAQRHSTMNKDTIIKMIMETIYGTGKLMLERKMTFEELVERVATKGGITEEGTKIIETELPVMINALFEKTLEKRKITTKKAQKEFGQ